ncbi:hypothetical protein [Hymenobacter rubripertinctus]|uniref:Lipocalin-like domain-containing protein n=1 Tax=Hymenobacter rubripertinctus TaxID=2029981 RepID=A0A418R326_9BACT|nr:hypothetical protein [Hymenobacter rubripertinctus]RIY11837.1 hypothetical protein D0T11_06700 [Hymenobacter rubripertinctus]
MLRFSLLVSLGLLTLGSCRKSEAPTPIQDKDWFSTFQTGKKGYTIYSTTTQSQGRRYSGFRLNTDGTYLEYALGPADGPVAYRGTWRAESGQTYRISFQDPARAGYQLRILKPAEEHLEARID